MAISSLEIIDMALQLADWDKLPEDSAIHVNGENMNKLLISVDVGIGELLLAKQLNCDGVIAHHPLGISHLNFHKVFDRHIEFMREENISPSVADDIVSNFKKRIEIKTQSSIYQNVVDAARLLDMPLLNIHQPCDEYMRKIIVNQIESRPYEFIHQILSSLNEIPEFYNSSTAILIPLGSPINKTEKWKVVIAAGTNGGYAIAKEYYLNNISTIIYLHIDPTEAEKLRKEFENRNLLVLGHLSGDSIGLNALANLIEKRNVEVIRLGIVPDKITNLKSKII